MTLGLGIRLRLWGLGGFCSEFRAAGLGLKDMGISVLRVQGAQGPGLYCASQPHWVAQNF